MAREAGTVPCRFPLSRGSLEHMVRRLLLAVVAVALLAGLSAGVASARLSGDERADRRSIAPFDAPLAAPAQDATQPIAYSFRPQSAIAADLAPAEPAASAPEAGGSVVTITATVLPTATVVVDGAGSVQEVHVNTPERAARDLVYVFRTDSTNGPAARLDDATWASARAALARTSAGTGLVWSA